MLDKCLYVLNMLSSVNKDVNNNNNIIIAKTLIRLLGLRSLI